MKKNYVPLFVIVDVDEAVLAFQYRYMYIVKKRRSE
jgi:hypothetical protein